MFDMMVIIVLLVLVNIFIAFARVEQRKWLRYILFVGAVIWLLGAILFGLRWVMQG